MSNSIAIIGRPNVGKSSLFNKLIGKRKSIIHDEAGVTRDRLYAWTEWSGHSFQIIDTGGIEMENRPFQENIQLQAKVAIDEADIIIFVVDGEAGVNSDDQYIASVLRKSKKKIIVAANKLENNRQMDTSIWAMGFEDIFSISAIHGEGVGDMLDMAIGMMEFSNNDGDEGTKLTIIGRPNAGKSSLLNKLTGKNRAIVSKISGTTRDSLSESIKIDDDTYSIIDTAGINRKSKLYDSVEQYALSRAMRSIDEADIVVLMIDYQRELAHFDSVVGGYAYEEYKPIIIVLNKWDLAVSRESLIKTKTKEIQAAYKYMPWAPIIFISALSGLNIKKIKKTVTEVKTNMTKTIKTSTLNEIMNEIQIIQPAQSYKGGRLNIKFVRQVEAHIPTFIFWVNNKKYLHFSYSRFLENKLREYFGFHGVPLRLVFRHSKGGKYE